MSQQSMKTHTIGTETFAIFSSEEKGGVWQLQFLWGKKDFRIHLGPGADAGGKLGAPALVSEQHGNVGVTQVQYLNAFEWYDFVKVAGHGLAHDEICWRRGNVVRYVELPKNFLDITVELACREFGLTRAAQQRAS